MYNESAPVTLKKVEAKKFHPAWFGYRRDNGDGATYDLEEGVTNINYQPESDDACSNLEIVFNNQGEGKFNDAQNF